MVEKTGSYRETAQLFRLLAHPARLRILDELRRRDEACVCHLEALLDMRQAYISQQLMEMRDAGLVDTRRDGRYIFYRLTEPDLLNLLIDIGKLFGVPTEEMERLLNAEPLPQCCCPDCIAQLNPTISKAVDSATSQE